MSGEGLYAKYEVRKRDEQVEDCFVLEPKDDRAARAALKAYAAATENDELAEDLLEQFGLERTPQQEWEAHNKSFSYEPPKLPGDSWSSEEYQELYDRCISRRVSWFCDKCSGQGPINSLQKARRHVERNHGQKLVEKHETPREEQDTATDGGTATPNKEQRESENHGLGEFSRPDSDR
jgi:hypothetical protein